ncbi:unnamed protein product [Leptosia nina]|uniref:Uncharacterized protein n=1 Tax=Leptosia nina TaxID=320188 RepID=A0AAV1J3W2_9NEOP
MGKQSPTQTNNNTTAVLFPNTTTSSPHITKQTQHYTLSSRRQKSGGNKNELSNKSWAIISGVLGTAAQVASGAGCVYLPHARQQWLLAFLGIKGFALKAVVIFSTYLSTGSRSEECRTTLYC